MLELVCAAYELVIKRQSVRIEHATIVLAHHKTISDRLNASREQEEVVTTSSKTTSLRLHAAFRYDEQDHGLGMTSRIMPSTNGLAIGFFLAF